MSGRGDPTPAVHAPARPTTRTAEATAASRRLWLRLSGLLLLAMVALVLATFRDYGITWDEAVQNRYGNRLVRWYASLGADDAALWQNNLYFYGGAFELVAQAARRVLPFGVYEARHLVNALFGLAGVVAAWGLGSRLAGPAAGFVSALLLVLTPRFYGDWYANPKDLPFASLFALAAWAILAAAEKLPRLGWRELTASGLAIGLASGVRVAGIVLFGYAAVLWLGWLWTSARPSPGSPAAHAWGDGRATPGALATGGWIRLAGAFVAVVALGWAVMVAVWPWALVQPFRNPFRAFAKLANFWDVVTILFDGRLVLARDLPRDYAPRWLALTLPETYGVAFLLGAAALLLRARRHASPSRHHVLAVSWVGSLAAFPIAWMVVRHTPLYNGVRHVLFLLPVLAVLAGVSVVAFFRASAARPPRALAAVALAASAVVTLVDMARLHPYEYVYFNRLVGGGLKGAVGRYETDYWCASFKEGLAWMVRDYRPRDAGPIRVAGLCSDEQLFYYLDGPEAARFDPGRHDSPDVVLATTALGDSGWPRGRVVHAVERQGAPLMVVFEARRAP